MTWDLEAGDRQAGFTLMEVLVAMTLLGLLMAALSGSIGFAGRSWDRSWKASEASAAYSHVEGMIRGMVERSFPASVRAEKSDRFLFEGTNQRLKLVAEGAPGGAVGGLYVQEIFIADTASGRQLVYRRFPFKATGTAPQQVEAAQLLTGDLAFAFSYYGSPSPTARAAWLDDWPSDRMLPDLIRLTIRSRDGEAWPPIIVRPIISAEHACVRATEGGLCRHAATAK